MQIFLDPRDPTSLGLEVQSRFLGDEAHAFYAPREAHCAARGDHGLRRDAVPEMCGTAHDVALIKVTLAPSRAA